MQPNIEEIRKKYMRWVEAHPEHWQDNLKHYDSAYAGTPPWDIGKPQPAFVKLAEADEIKGSVLDVGCGTGENALFLARLGHEVWGVDSSPIAIRKAKAKSKKRGIKVNFLNHNALLLTDLNRRFDSAIDSGLFHGFDDEEREFFQQSLAAALRPGGTYFMMCFSEEEPAGWGGPRRVTQREIRKTFRTGWKVNYIREARFETNWPEIVGMAWLSSISRLG
jgi:SAM-dependent methyltransferase